MNMINVNFSINLLNSEKVFFDSLLLYNTITFTE